MQWLMALETNSDPITACRLMNIFRRKSVDIVTLTMGAHTEGFSLLALVETAEAEVEHIFHFLRRTEGVRHITYYRHEPAGDASFVFIDGDPNASRVTRFLQSFPESRLVFASHGKYLLEIPAPRRPHIQELSEAEFLPFARVKTSVPQPELVAAQVS